MFSPPLICSNLIHKLWLALVKNIYRCSLTRQQLTVRMLRIIRAPLSKIVLFLVAFVVVFSLFLMN